MKPSPHQLYLQACERMKARGFSPEVIAAFSVVRAVVITAALSAPAAASQVLHHDASGNPVFVTVVSADCPDQPGFGCYLSHVVYTMGNDLNLSHELAHVAGMRHTPWTFTRWGIPCATVTVSGLDTGYRVGDVICNGLRGEMVERK